MRCSGGQKASPATLPYNLGSRLRTTEQYSNGFITLKLDESSKTKGVFLLPGMFILLHPPRQRPGELIPTACSRTTPNSTTAQQPGGICRPGTYIRCTQPTLLSHMLRITDRLIWEIDRFRMKHICSHMSSILGICIRILPIALPTSCSLQTHVSNTRVQALQPRREIYAPCD